MRIRSLRTWLWVSAGAALLVWTLFAWIAAAAIGQTSELVAWLEAPLAGIPNVFGWLQHAAVLAEPLGAALIWGIWLAGVLLLAAATAALASLLSKRWA